MKTNTKLTHALNLDYKEEEKIWLSDQDSLRILVGILGITLPLMLWATLLVYSGYTSPMESISHYYYTRVSSVFVIVLSLLAIFLLLYKGKEPIDFFLSSAAGIFALCVVLFPTDNISGLSGNYINEVAVTTLPVDDFRKSFHLFSAAIFLSCLAFMSLFIFTKSAHAPKNRTKNKKRRNRIYRTCGAIMVMALLVVVAKQFKLIENNFYLDHHLTFWMETVAVTFFGISWLVKAEVVLKG